MDLCYSFGALAEGLQAGAGYAYGACPVLALQRPRSVALSVAQMHLHARGCNYLQRFLCVCVWSLQVSALLVVYWMCSL
jgi:hypothetical protein